MVVGFAVVEYFVVGLKWLDAVCDGVIVAVCEGLFGGNGLYSSSDIFDISIYCHASIDTREKSLPPNAYILLSNIIGDEKHTVNTNLSSDSDTSFVLVFIMCTAFLYTG